MRRALAIAVLFVCSCFLIGDDDGDTDSGGGGTGGPIPEGYPTYFVGESQIYSAAPATCVGPDIDVSPGVSLSTALDSTDDTALNINYGQGYAWSGILHCDPASVGSCSPIEHKISDWTDDLASNLYGPLVRQDDLYADSVTLSVFVGHGRALGEALIFPEEMPTQTSNSCKLFFAEDVRLNAGSFGAQGANGLVLAAPCFGSASNWDTSPVQSAIMDRSHLNRVYAFGGGALLLSENQLASWWENLLQPGQFATYVVEGWNHWYLAMNNSTNAYSNLAMIATMSHTGESVEELIDRHSLGNIRSGYHLDSNPFPKPLSPLVVDWVFVNAPTECS